MQMDVISVGNMLVEIMREKLDEPLHQTGTFVGPFPSGDTVIYIDTIARLGHSAGFIGVVGDDDFGKCLLDRLRADNVDCSGIQILKEYATGVAFVAYFKDGSRKFLFHWRHAAAGQLHPQHIDRNYIHNTKWLHLTGCNLAACESSRQACLKALEWVTDDTMVSFDPNIRPEILSIEQIFTLCQPVFKRANVFLPSLNEAMMFTGADSDEKGCRKLAKQDKLVVLKRGAKGCTIFTGHTEIEVPGFIVEEVDPTGAGDSFCAGVTVGLLEGMKLEELGRFANAVGALSVTRKGPMEGAPTRQDVDKFLKITT